jgi:hypothetical protein
MLGCFCGGKSFPGCGTIKIPPCSKALSAEHMPKYVTVVVAAALIIFALKEMHLRMLFPKSFKHHFLIFIPQRNHFSGGIYLPIAA